MNALRSSKPVEFNAYASTHSASSPPSAQLRTGRGDPYAVAYQLSDGVDAFYQQ